MTFGPRAGGSAPLCSPAVVLRRHWGLLAVLGAGILLRAVLLAAYSPAYLSYPDTWGYAKAAGGPLFMPDWIRPAGYPALLAGLHAVWGSLTFTIVVQHLLGLATAVLAYATLQRAGAPRWVALVPAVVLTLTLDAIYYEHTLLSETPFTLLVTGALYCGVRSLEERSGIGWPIACGLLLGLAVTFRGIALFAIPVFVLALLLRDGGWRRRLAGAGATAIAVVALLVSYAALQESQNGYFGLTQGSGWSTYARSAPFADCRVFDPPGGGGRPVRSARRPRAPRPGLVRVEPGVAGTTALPGAAAPVRAGRLVRARRDRGAAARLPERGRDGPLALRRARRGDRPRRQRRRPPRRWTSTSATRRSRRRTSRRSSPSTATSTSRSTARSTRSQACSGSCGCTARWSLLCVLLSVAGLVLAPRTAARGDPAAGRHGHGAMAPWRAPPRSTTGATSFRCCRRWRPRGRWAPRSSPPGGPKGERGSGALWCPPREHRPPTAV